MNYSVIPTLALPQTVVPERAMPGWVFIIIIVHPYWTIYAAVRGKDIVMTIRQDTINAPAIEKSIVALSRVISIAAAGKETDAAIGAREKTIEIDARTKTAVAEH